MCIRDRVWKTDYAPHSPEEAFHPRFVEALQKQAHVEYLLDVLLFGETCLLYTSPLLGTESHTRHRGK